MGYPFIAIGYNAGIKLRYVTFGPRSRVSPFVTGMYGYNTAISVANATRYNKLFYGITIGCGLDIKFKPTHHSYMSIGILVPLRGAEVNDYITDLKTTKGVTFSKTLSPVGLTIGFKISFNLKN